MVELRKTNEKKISKEKLVLIIEEKYNQLSRCLKESIYKDLILDGIENIESNNYSRWDEIVVGCGNLALAEVKEGTSFDEAYEIIYKSVMKYNELKIEEYVV